MGYQPNQSPLNVGSYSGGNVFRTQNPALQQKVANIKGGTSALSQ
jgi:hypothetical protein